MGQLPTGTVWAIILSWNTYLGNNLPSFNADPDSITFSGFSGGSWMAHHMHVANSERIAGVGLFNGGSYGSLFDRSDLTAGRDKRPSGNMAFDTYFSLSEGIANSDS